MVKSSKSEYKGIPVSEEFYLNNIELDDVKESITDDPMELERQYWLQKSQECDKKLTANPRDEKNWLEFVQIQDKTFKFSFSDGKTEAALSDRKLAILEKGINILSNKDNEMTLNASNINNSSDSILSSGMYDTELNVFLI